MKTEKYNNMISAFQCDFTIAINNSGILLELRELIENKDSRLLKDIELLEELEFLLRNGKAEIHIN